MWIQGKGLIITETAAGQTATTAPQAAAVEGGGGGRRGRRVEGDVLVWDRA
jgi:hypothetical protein